MRGLVLATASVLALGLGGAGAANAWSGGHSGSATGPHAATMSPARTAAMPRTSSSRTTGGAVRQAQLILRRDGLYRGRIDGIDGPMTRQAIARFQRHNGLRATGRLDRSTLASLTGGGTAGYGASRMHRRAMTGRTAPPPTETGGQGTGGGGPNPPNNATSGAPAPAPAPHH